MTHIEQIPTSLRILIGIICMIPLLLFLRLAASIFWGYPMISLPLTIIYPIIIFHGAFWIYFFYLVFQIETIGTGSRILWCFRLLILSIIAMPIFWYFFILNYETYGLFDEEEYEETDLYN